MQILLDKTPLICSENLPKNAFRIEASPHAFSILSKSLYSNPILAVVRELSTNALDSHIMAGCPDKPFDVHLPNSLEPYFSVRDYGVGLTESEVYELYTTYFASGEEKLSSNRLIGGFGLGSKSVFAYTDTATLTIYLNNKRSDYSLVIENGFPQVIKLNSNVSTDEPNGVLIKLPLKDRYDISLFEDAAKKVYLYFKVQANILGREYNHVPVEYVVKTDEWGIRKENRSNCTIIMGNIPYITNAQGLGGVDFFCNVGDCEITPSREALNYTNKTKNKLKLLTDNFKISSQKYILDKIFECKTVWEARLLALDLYSFISTGTKYKDVSITANNVSVKIQQCRYIYKQWSKLRIENSNIVYINSNVCFYEDDIIGSVSRCKNFVNKNTDKNVYLCKFTDDNEKQEFCDKLGILPSQILLASSLDRPTVIKSGSKNLSNDVLKFHFSDYRQSTQPQNYFWSNSTDILIPNDYYVNIVNKSVLYNKVRCHPYILNEHIKSLQTLGIVIPTSIYGIKKGVKILSGAINFLEYATDEIIKKINTKDMVDNICIYKYFTTNNHKFLDRIHEMFGSIGNTIKSQEIKSIIGYYGKYLSCGLSCNFIWFLDKYKFVVPDSNIEHNINTLINDTHKKYPLLYILLEGINSWESKDLEHVIKYVNDLA